MLGNHPTAAPGGEKKCVPYRHWKSSIFNGEVIFAHMIFHGAASSKIPVPYVRYKWKISLWPVHVLVGPKIPCYNAWEK